MKFFLLLRELIWFGFFPFFAFYTAKRYWGDRRRYHLTFLEIGCVGLVSEVLLIVSLRRLFTDGFTERWCFWLIASGTLYPSMWYIWCYFLHRKMLSERRPS